MGWAAQGHTVQFLSVALPPEKWAAVSWQALALVSQMVTISASLILMARGSWFLSKATAFNVNLPSGMPLARPCGRIQKVSVDVTGKAGQVVDVALKLLCCW